MSSTVEKILRFFGTKKIEYDKFFGAEIDLNNQMGLSGKGLDLSLYYRAVFLVFLLACALPLFLFYITHGVKKKTTPEEKCVVEKQCEEVGLFERLPEEKKCRTSATPAVVQIMLSSDGDRHEKDSEQKSYLRLNVARIKALLGPGSFSERVVSRLVLDRSKIPTYCQKNTVATPYAKLGISLQNGTGSKRYENLQMRRLVTQLALKVLKNHTRSKPSQYKEQNNYQVNKGSRETKRKIAKKTSPVSLNMDGIKRILGDDSFIGRVMTGFCQRPSQIPLYSKVKNVPKRYSKFESTSTKNHIGTKKQREQKGGILPSGLAQNPPKTLRNTNMKNVPKRSSKFESTPTKIPICTKKQLEQKDGRLPTGVAQRPLKTLKCTKVKNEPNRSSRFASNPTKIPGCTREIKPQKVNSLSDMVALVLSAIPIPSYLQRNQQINISQHQRVRKSSPIISKEGAMRIFGEGSISDRVTSASAQSPSRIPMYSKKS